MFSFYFELGIQHIADINAYDHIVFIVAIASMYTKKDWKKLAVLVTAFTIGHSITLALAVYQLVFIPARIIEFLIPLTILLTALSNIFLKSGGNEKLRYLTVLFFGLIHGMGFSTFLITLLGGEESIVIPLFAFNIGLEVGQLLIILVFMLLSILITGLFKIKKEHWNYFITTVTITVSLILMYKTKFW